MYKIISDKKLDDAIKHCFSKMDNTPCGKNHAELFNMLLELRDRRTKEQKND